MKLRKRNKRSRIRGTRTCGWAMKKHKGGKGNKGGIGMAGTGKRADHKKSWVLVYSYPYFGKKGTTSKSTERKKNPVLNLDDIEMMANKTKKNVLELKEYKILGNGTIKIKVTIHAKAASKQAMEKIRAAGGEIILEEEKKKEEAKSVSEKKSIAAKEKKK